MRREAPIMAEDSSAVRVGTAPDHSAKLPAMDGRGQSPSVATIGRQVVSQTGLRDALRRVRDPLVLGALPALYAVSALMSAHDVVGMVGFDFRGTLWEPARSLLDGAAIYPTPTRAAIEIGNPAVYPPFVVMLVAPLGLLSAGAASVVWAAILGLGVTLSLRLLGVRDWRCYAVALASAPVLDGLFWGNVSLLMLVPVALAWRYRDCAWVAGLAVGAAVAAKLFVWPLVVWLLLTKRFRAAAWASGSAVALVLGAWAAIEFEGLVDYPNLLGELQDVYAQRSLSLATVAGGFGASVAVAVALAGAAGLVLLALAAGLARRADGDRRAFSVLVLASVVASPIVWVHYWALLFVPIAIRWRRLSAAWFFGFVVLLPKHLPGLEYVVPEPCCRPADVPKFVWDVNHAIPHPWQALGVLVVVGVVAATLLHHAGTSTRLPAGDVPRGVA